MTPTPATLKFRDDIDPATTWVVSDTHFGHENIIGFCHRPEEHEQVMIAEWRKAVPDDATVLHLGDVCYGHAGGNTRFRRLTSKELTGGRKLLIRGNHDNQSMKFYRDSGFQVVRPFSITYPGDEALCSRCGGSGVWGMGNWEPLCSRCNGVGRTAETWNVSFSHYPWSDAEERHTQTPRDVRVHGHIHNNGYTRDGYVPFLRGHINVSVEQTRYTPVNLKLLLDAALLGRYPATTDEQQALAQQRRKERN